MNSLLTFALRSTLARLRLVPIACFVLAGIASCGGGGDNGGGAAGAVGSAATGPASDNPAPVTTTAAGASVVRTLEVPASLASAPFDSAKSLTVPPGFGVRLWARIPNARFMTLAPNGDVLVSVPGAGKIELLRGTPGAVPQIFDFATGLTQPQDMVFHTTGGVTYLYVAESNRVTRSVYHAGDTASAAREVVVDKLPDSSLPELQGSYAHALKDIAIGPDDKLYVSIGSSCNACASDTTADPVRGAIYQYNADGSGGRLFARGLRNAEGLDFIPGTNMLWAAVNNRDQIQVPVDEDVNGDGSDDIGQVVQAYVDNNPAELFTRVVDGGNYGWPYCNAAPNAGMSNLDSLPDYSLNRNQSVLDCSAITRPSKGIEAHSAPLGLSFLQASGVPAAYRQGAAIALHGCWNCSAADRGYKVVFFPFDSAGNAGSQVDLVTGFVTDPASFAVWGRPVDVIADAHGDLLISDDQAGAIYLLYPAS